MRECSNCRENDRKWNCSLNYRCDTETCENYIPLYNMSVPNDVDISGTFDTVLPNDEYPRININKTNECTICGGEYRYRKSFVNYVGRTPVGLYEIKLRTSHPACDSIMKRLEKAKRDALDCEFELFSRKIQACKLK